MTSNEDVVAGATKKFSDYIAAEVFATEIHVGETPPSAAFTEHVEVDQGGVQIGLRPATT